MITILKLYRTVTLIAKIVQTNVKRYTIMHAQYQSCNIPMQALSAVTASYGCCIDSIMAYLLSDTGENNHE